jgi:hypothetical protein
MLIDRLMSMGSEKNLLGTAGAASGFNYDWKKFQQNFPFISEFKYDCKWIFGFFLRSNQQRQIGFPNKHHMAKRPSAEKLLFIPGFVAPFLSLSLLPINLNYVKRICQHFALKGKIVE